tara:strand:- start:19422 stop:19931 length:510 start_codon:yes stop_codon:yes gene_type:complete
MNKIIFLFLLIFITDYSLSEENHYSVIVSNNLFRPLGWTPPRVIPEWKLIGTIIGKDYKIAYVSNIKTSSFQRLAIGDTFGSHIVDDIQQNKLLTKKGIKYEFRKPIFLNTRNNKRKSKTKETSGGIVRTTGITNGGESKTTRQNQTARRSRRRERFRERFQELKNRFE